MSRKKWHDKEFRMAAVKLALTTDKPVREVAEELGVSDTAVRNWISLYGTGQGDGSSGFTPEEHAEVIKLRRDLRRVTEERDVLKKALGILSKELP
jgi:transposase